MGEGDLAVDEYTREGSVAAADIELCELMLMTTNISDTPVSNPVKRWKGKRDIESSSMIQAVGIWSPHTIYTPTKRHGTCPPQNDYFRSAGVKACTTLVPSTNLVLKIRFAFWNIPSFNETTMN